jgi:hypothetical protein
MEKEINGKIYLMVAQTEHQRKCCDGCDFENKNECDLAEGICAEKDWLHHVWQLKPIAE